jgi:hypothetical protein
MAMEQTDISGNRYGLLTEIKWVKNEKFVAKSGSVCYHNYWEFKCDCGKSKVIRKWRVAPYNETSIKSCGCLVNISKRKGFEEMSGSQWCTIKKGANQRKIAFEITIEEVWNLFLKQAKKCALSGEEIKFSKINPWYKETTASLDRINSEKEYTIDNIQWVHKDVNLMKFDLPEERFLDLVEKIYNYRLRKGD